LHNVTLKVCINSISVLFEVVLVGEEGGFGGVGGGGGDYLLPYVIFLNRTRIFGLF